MDILKACSHGQLPLSISYKKEIISEMVMIPSSRVSVWPTEVNAAAKPDNGTSSRVLVTMENERKEGIEHRAFLLAGSKSFHLVCFFSPSLAIPKLLAIRGAEGSITNFARQNRTALDRIPFYYRTGFTIELTSWRCTLSLRSFVRDAYLVLCFQAKSVPNEELMPRFEYGKSPVVLSLDLSILMGIGFTWPVEDACPKRKHFY